MPKNLGIRNHLYASRLSFRKNAVQILFDSMLILADSLSSTGVYFRRDEIAGQKNRKGDSPFNCRINLHMSPTTYILCTVKNIFIKQRLY